jgi:hypothetical protein
MRAGKSLMRVERFSLPLKRPCPLSPATDKRRKPLYRSRRCRHQLFGPVDILLAFAGGGNAMPAPVDQTTEDDWRSSIDHNLTATFLTLKAFLPGMKERRAGAIVTMASTAGRHASSASPAYAAAKAGVIMLTRHLAQEVGPMNIRVNCLSPSAILTERTAHHLPETKRAEIAALHPLNRLGTPADVAAAALFLEMRPHPSQGEGRVQIVVEPKQELPFENCTAETTGGAAKRGGGPNHAGYPSSARLCNRAPPRESTLHCV